MNKLLELQLKASGSCRPARSTSLGSLGDALDRRGRTELTTATHRVRLTSTRSSSRSGRTPKRTRLEAARLVHTTDPEVREQRALCGRANVGEIIHGGHGAAIGGRGEPGSRSRRSTVGPNQVPLEMLRLEQRAVTPSIGKRGDRGSGRAAPPSFRPASARSWAVDRPTVAMGDAVYPVLTTRPTVGGPHSGQSTDVPDTTGGFRRGPTCPRANSARVSSTSSDGRDPVSGDGPEPCGKRLNGGLEEKLDYEVIAGTERAVDRCEPGESTTSLR